MSVFKKEMIKGMKGFTIWTFSIAFMILICIFMFPEIKNQMNGMNDLFANMGSFTKAFGMDTLNFGTLIGFYGVECGNMLGIGGGFFASFIGITILSKEEKNHTSEFLFSHPISRASVVLQKVLAILAQIIILNAFVFILSVVSICLIGEAVPWMELTLINIAYMIAQIEIALICFGISAFLRKGSIGIGLGLAALFYFCNIIRNISDKADFLKYFSPFAYAEPSIIIEDKALNPLLISIGIAFSALFLAIGFHKYTHKDLAS